MASRAGLLVLDRTQRTPYERQRDRLVRTALEEGVQDLDAAIGELDMTKVNVNGGAIALGHPIAATGARLVLTLAHELRQQSARYGLATLCIGGGQGQAIVLEAA